MAEESFLQLNAADRCRFICLVKMNLAVHNVDHVVAIVIAVCSELTVECCCLRAFLYPHAAQLIGYGTPL